MFSYGPDEISSFSSGTAIAGVGCAFISVILTYVPLDVMYQYIIYLVFCTCLCILILITFVAFIKRYAGSFDTVDGDSDKGSMGGIEPHDKFRKENEMAKNTINWTKLENEGQDGEEDNTKQRVVAAIPRINVIREEEGDKPRSELGSSKDFFLYWNKLS